MSALRKTDLQAGPGPQVGGRPPTRRPVAGRPAVGAAGQTRRNLQRDLARREASLRISRRVSGPAGGVSRPPLRDPEAGLELAPRFDGPIGLTRTQPSVAPRRAPEAPLPAARVAHPAPAPAPNRSPQPAVAPAPRPAPSRFATAVAARGLRSAAPVSGPVARSAMPFDVFAPATGAATIALPQPAAAPKRSPLTALPGGLTEVAPNQRRRLSTPAMIVASLVLIVVTVGAIVALQIQMTQVNERMGSDLGSITRYQQSTTALREKISRQVSGAQIDGEVSRRGMIEPEATDARYLRAGNRAVTAEKAAEALKAAASKPAAAVSTVGAVTGSAASATTGTADAAAGTSTEAPATATP